MPSAAHERRLWGRFFATPAIAGGACRSFFKEVPAGLFSYDWLIPPWRACEDSDSTSFKCLSWRSASNRNVVWRSPSGRSGPGLFTGFREIEAGRRRTVRRRDRKVFFFF